jgi:hypothetical protein
VKTNEAVETPTCLVFYDNAQRVCLVTDGLLFTGALLLPHYKSLEVAESELLKGVSELLEGTHKFDGRPITARPTPPVWDLKITIDNNNSISSFSKYKTP